MHMIMQRLGSVKPSKVTWILYLDYQADDAVDVPMRIRCLS